VIGQLDKYNALGIEQPIDKVDGKPAKVIDHSLIYLGGD